MQGHFEIVFCTYFKNIVKFRYKYEVYDTHTVFCLKSGKFKYQIDSEPGKIISEGEVVVCPPGKRFTREIIEPVELCMIKFRFNDDSVFLGNHIKCIDRLRFNCNMEILENCIHCKDMDSNPVFTHYATDILYSLNKSSENINPVFVEIKEMIESGCNMEVKDMANKCGYSTVHFINKFKSYFGYTPKKYASYVKLKKARELLLGTNMISKEIASLCGFDDELYFIRFFKNNVGMTPSEFRKTGI